MFWRDLEQTSHGTAWAGLELEVEAPARPGLRVEVATPSRVRVSSGDVPVLWGRVHEFHAAVWWLRSGRYEPVVEPLQAAESRAIAGPPRSAAWYRAWARVFAEKLAASPKSPLHRGRWLLEVAAWPSASAPDHIEVLQGVVTAPLRHVVTGAEPRHDVEDWIPESEPTLLTLRAPSRPDAARVKALRKLARDGDLAPLLAWFVSGLELHLLIDGHDRLQAALQEGVTPAVLVLGSVDVERSDDTTPQARRALGLAEQLADASTRPRPAEVERVNRALLDAFADDLWRRTWAWPLEGGRATWHRQVHAELRGDPVPPWVLEPPPR